MGRRNNKKNIEDFYSQNRYIDYLLSTETYKDLYRSKEAVISIILSSVLTLFVSMLIYLSPTIETNEQLISLLTLAVGSIVGLLGFIIGGLALIVGSIGKKMIGVINDSGNFIELLGIVFRFYFIGSVLGASVIIHIFTYLIILLPFDYNLILSIVMTFFNGYAFFFSLISSIMLMGSCIRLMLLQYALDKN
ncbi:hypothetical protein M4I74_01455 [Enterococcus faecium]|uniref:hypothetical protein n=1 Tax=Enterococcus TaxID=1350 RepID=UPI0002A2A571|nr:MULTISPECIES: hypothetical protein [Enterococcus]EGP4716674.1 hypothetical protein [Enterococcus faecium]ELA92292.1 hypothetical protein OI5_02904 [Enterococcus faecium EnGen0009]EMF0102649.1 hypothetical protein [Enterococcus hirae]MBE8861432.1 hypothetical protein [Enterococcus faecium]MDA5326876.1 hypothetical protein [Enterococcus lactis]